VRLAIAYSYVIALWAITRAPVAATAVTLGVIRFVQCSSAFVNANEITCLTLTIAGGYLVALLAIWAALSIFRPRTAVLSDSPR
jgi:hypothetical protein